MFWKNIEPNQSIDETSLSDGELYTIVSNKDVHGRKGAIVAIVQGTKVEDVVTALQRILWWERAMVLEVTMDFSDCQTSTLNHMVLQVPRDFHIISIEDEVVSTFSIMESNSTENFWILILRLGAVQPDDLVGHHS